MSLIETIAVFIFINALIIVTVFGAVAIKNNDCREIRAVINGETKGE